MRIEKNYVIMGALVALSAGLMLLGEPAKEDNRVHRMTNELQLPSAKATAEMTKVSLEGASLQMTHGGRRMAPSWSVLRTKDWAIVSPTTQGELKCPALLHDYIVASNGPHGATWQLVAIDSYLNQNKNATVNLRLFVPRFKQAPAKLGRCKALGFDYDAATQRLTFEGKPVAVWANEQPEATITLPVSSEAPLVRY